MWVCILEEINLYKLLRFYVQNWLIIASLAFLGFVGGLVYNEFVQTPLYKSSATLLFINPNGRGSTQDATWLNNYVQLFQSRRVIEPVLEKQHINKSFDAFISSVNATNDKGTEVIKLSVSTDNPEVSQRFLREAIGTFKEEAKELYGTDNLRVVDNASQAEPPYNVKKELQLAIATGAGFVVSLITLFFIYDASNGKAGKLGVKKRVATKKSKTAKTTKIKTLKTPKTVNKSDSKFKVMLTNLSHDLKKGLWVEPGYMQYEDNEAKAPDAKAPKKK